MPGQSSSTRKVYQAGTFCTLYFCFFVLFSFQSHAQRVKIDSLKKILPTLEDNVRVDCLNLLSLVYSYLDTDTAEAYQQKAYTEASRIR